MPCQTNKFRIGNNTAGFISAGAYTAGVWTSSWKRWKNGKRPKINDFPVHLHQGPPKLLDPRAGHLGLGAYPRFALNSQQFILRFLHLRALTGTNSHLLRFSVASLIRLNGPS